MNFTINKLQGNLNSTNKVDIYRLLLDNELIFINHFAHPLINNQNEDKMKYIECFLPGYNLAIEFKTSFYYQNENVAAYIDEKIKRLENSNIDLVVIDLMNTKKDQIFQKLNISLTQSQQKDPELKNQTDNYVKYHSQLIETIFDYYNMLNNADVFIQYGIPSKLIYGGFVAMQAKSDLLPLATYDEFMTYFKFLLTNIHNYKSVLPKNSKIKKKYKTNDIQLEVFNTSQFIIYIKSLIEKDPIISAYFDLNNHDTNSMFYNESFNHDKKSARTFKDLFKDCKENNQLQNLRYGHIPSNAGLLIKDVLQEMNELDQSILFASNDKLIKEYIHYDS